MTAQIFNTDKGVSVHVLPITISLGHSASFRALIFTGNMSYGKLFNLEGTEYTNWGSNDDYIKEYICHKEGFIGRPIADTDAEVYQAPTPNEPNRASAIVDDNRSVHNEADIQKIQTLQEQLDAQAAKLKTITDMLIGKGLV